MIIEYYEYIGLSITVYVLIWITPIIGILKMLRYFENGGSETHIVLANIDINSYWYSELDLSVFCQQKRC